MRPAEHSRSIARTAAVPGSSGGHPCKEPDRRPPASWSRPAAPDRRRRRRTGDAVEQSGSICRTITNGVSPSMTRQVAAGCGASKWIEIPLREPQHGVQRVFATRCSSWMRIAPRRNRQLRADRHGCSATPAVDLGAGHAGVTQRSRTCAVGSMLSPLPALPPPRHQLAPVLRPATAPDVLVDAPQPGSKR